MNRYCAKCKQTKLFAAFRYTSQLKVGTAPRHYMGRTCNLCRTAALLKDERKLETAMQRGEVGYARGSTLLKQYRANSAAREAANRKRISEQTQDRHRMWRYFNRYLNVYAHPALRFDKDFIARVEECKRKYEQLKARVRKGDHSAQAIYASLALTRDKFATDKGGTDKSPPR